ncbi:DUF6491 family protein [Aquimonas voraii]|uniref:Uncharacterized protein n=1 Tax=Aquimonas voraii TaxID=265719 RepID=A0A1G6U570_9GAMM|nr:DUF6491 family protein [Aquimonas voraii]SDD36530.1 hypothetical protein SAMN04488509_102172 [Aquimonas voraii]
MFLRSLLLLSCCAYSSFALADAPRAPAPTPDCLDARQVDRLYPVSPWQLAVVQADGRRFRVELDSACPVVLEDAAKLSLLSQEGWACGGPREFIVDANTGTACAIAALAPADAREFAALLREAGQGDDVRLAPLEVKAKAPRGFRGSHDHCFAARHVRGWSESGEALEVEVAARRSGGNLRYRVELDETCPDLGRAITVAFRSGTDNGVICGHAGDRVELMDVGLIPVAPLGSRCAIREVFPIAQVAR